MPANWNSSFRSFAKHSTNTLSDYGKGLLPWLDLRQVDFGRSEVKTSAPSAPLRAGSVSAKTQTQGRGTLESFDLGCAPQLREVRFGWRVWNIHEIFGNDQ